MILISDINSIKIALSLKIVGFNRLSNQSINHSYQLYANRYPIFVLDSNADLTNYSFLFGDSRWDRLSNWAGRADCSHSTQCWDSTPKHNKTKSCSLFCLRKTDMQPSNCKYESTLEILSVIDKYLSRCSHDALQSTSCP